MAKGFCVSGTDAGGKSRRQQSQTGDQRGHHGMGRQTQAAEASRVAVRMSLFSQAQLIDVGDEDDCGFD